MPVADGVWAVNLSPEMALREYGEMVLKVGRPGARGLRQPLHEDLLPRHAGPLRVGDARQGLVPHDRDAGGRLLRFDVVLLDAPATGHGLDMLRVPKVILDVVPPGVLRRDAEAAWTMFRDPTRSGVVVVTLPEEMPTTETDRARARRSAESSGLPVLGLVVNGVLDPLFSPEEREALLGDPRLLEIDAPARAAGTSDSAVVAGARRAVRERVQAESLARLARSIDLPTVRLPFLFDEASTVEGTRMLAERLC